MNTKPSLSLAFAALVGLSLVLLGLLPLLRPAPSRGRPAVSSLSPTLPPLSRATLALSPAQVAFQPGPLAATAAAALPTFTPLPALDPPLQDERPGAPVRLRIPALGLDAPIVNVGWHLDPGAPAPLGAWDTALTGVGHHRGSADPGAPGNCVLAAHSAAGDAPFQRLDELALGQSVELESRDGRRFTYGVDQVLRLDETAASETARQEHARWLDPTAAPVLTLVTCWPPWAYTHRLVVRATLVGPPLPLHPSDAVMAAPQDAPSAAPSPCAEGLALTARVDPPFAGPGDSVAITVEVIYEGAQPPADLSVACAFPAPLEPVDSDCQVCDWLPDARRLWVQFDALPPGEPASFFVEGAVSPEAWPGRSLTVVCQAQAQDRVLCAAPLVVALPWAPLPQVGHPAGGGRRAR